MQINFLREVVESVAGKPAADIVNLLVGKKDVNEFIIAKKLKLTINQARNILYKLSEVGLVTSIRKKDKRKGWFIYFWTFDSLRALELLEKRFLLDLKTLKQQLQVRKSKRFYCCKLCSIEVGEETALLNQFTCQECGQVYDLSDNNKPIKELESRIAKLEKQLAEITQERELLSYKKDKKIKRKSASIKRKESKARKLKREKNKKEKRAKEGIKKKPVKRGDGKKKAVKKKIIKKKIVKKAKKKKVVKKKTKKKKK